MHGTMTRKFVDLMAEYQELQNKYKNKYREKVPRPDFLPPRERPSHTAWLVHTWVRVRVQVERQYRIVKPHATKEEIEEVGSV